MLRFAAIAIALVAVVAVLASSATSVPSPLLARIGASHGQPRAGHTFTAFVVTPDSAQIQNVHCDATVRGRTLTSRTRRFPAAGGFGSAVAVSCGWEIPINARGILAASARVETTDGFTSIPLVRWHIKR